MTDRADRGVIANYEPPASGYQIATDSTNRGGLASFDVVLVNDQEAGAPVGAPPALTGRLRWLCGDPPAM